MNELNLEPLTSPHLAQRVFNRPLLLSPVYAQAFFGALSERFDIASMVMPDGSRLDAKALQAQASVFARPPEKKPYRVHDGVAMIPASGTLAHKFGYLNPMSGMTGYDGIARKLHDAMADPEVRGVLLDFNTPGGEVSGCFDLADQIYQLRDIKPIWALADEMACSAGIALASAANRVILPRTAQLGSVGVLTAHADISQRNKERGIDVTLIYAGDHKVDGNPHEPLPAAVQASIQAEIDQLYGMFTDLVARNRKLSTQAVIDTQAQIYTGQAAVDARLADDVLPAHEVVPAFIEHLSSSGRTTTLGGSSMAKKDAETETNKPTAAPAAATAPTGDEVAVNAAQAQQDERTRIAGILSCEEAKGREAQAQHLALNTSMSVEVAQGILAAAPVAAPAAAADPLSAAMATSAQPEVESDAADNTDETTGASAMAAVFDKIHGKGA